MMTRDRMIAHLHSAGAVARDAVAHGHHPFGAVLLPLHWGTNGNQVRFLINLKWRSKLAESLLSRRLLIAAGAITAITSGISPVSAEEE